MITRLDFVAVPSTDAQRSRDFYVDTLGLRPDDSARFEFWAGATCFAIWEPASRQPLRAAVAAGRGCPRKFLVGARPALLDPPDPAALDNVNATHEYWSAMETLRAVAAPLRIRVQYFALLREQAGRGEETLETRARTPRELYGELRARHPFTLPPELLRVAVNAEFGDWAQPLADGDAVVFIPPVAGG